MVAESIPTRTTRRMPMPRIVPLNSDTHANLTLMTGTAVCLLALDLSPVQSFRTRCLASVRDGCTTGLYVQTRIIFHALSPLALLFPTTSALSVPASSTRSHMLIVDRRGYSDCRCYWGRAVVFLPLCKPQLPWASIPQLVDSYSWKTCCSP